ncbi:MAG: ATP-binding cassette domain-containing protein [Spirochaetaceae bacterium]|jgi:energy-coupling factor transporter ATP-binding protein EcfA2|nr:ATP-binding cassette domain-containing protein [Spirochaetaceae bacterium]
MGEPIITLKDVFYRYPRTGVWALKGLNLEVGKGEFVAVMGENGAGKTTLCKLFNGIIPHSQEGVLKGMVTVDGMVTAETSVPALAASVGMVLEDPESQLFTTVVRNEVAFGPENLLVPPEEIGERVSWALEVVGLSGCIDKAPGALSGGQKQRLVIASALAMAKKILVLDEPTSQLDPAGTRDVFSVIREIREKYNMTVIMATHKSEEIAEFADRVCILKNGRVAALDRPAAVFCNLELLRDNRIKPPDVSALANYMAERGEGLGVFPILQEEAYHAVIDWYRGK